MKRNSSSSGSNGRALPKFMILLAVGSLALAAMVVYSVKYLVKESMEKAALARREASAKVEPSVPAPELSPTPAEPAGLVLARGLLNGNPADRIQIVMQLAALPNPQPEAVEELGRSLSISSVSIKTDALSGLAALAKNNPQSVDFMIKALEDRSIRMEAIKTLGELGPTAVTAVPSLKKIALNQKEKKMTRMAARSALAKIQPQRAVLTKKKKPGRRVRNRRP